MILSPNERLIVVSLYDQPKCPYEIAQELNKQDTAIATNLRKMQQLNLVKYQRTGIRKYSLTKFGGNLYELLSTHDASFRDLITEYKNQRKENYF